MPQRRDNKKGPSAKDRRPIKKKTSILNSENIAWIDYKDVNLLRRFMSERAKIRARRVTGNDQQQQAAVAKAIKLAREMALLPYSVRQVTHRSKGRRGERGERGERELSASEVGAEAPRSEGAESVEELDVMVEADEMGSAEGTQNGDDALITDARADDGEDDE